MPRDLRPGETILPLDTVASEHGREIRPGEKILPLTDRSRGPSFTEGVGAGLLDKLYGVEQLGVVDPEVMASINYGELQRAIDQKVRQRGASLEREGYNRGWGRTVGNIAGDVALTAPLMAFMPEYGAASFLGRVGYGALTGATGGAIAGATQSVERGSFASGKTGQILGSAAGGAALGGLGGALGYAFISESPAAVERFITDAYQKAIRPTVVGKGTGAKITAADQNVLSSLSSIIGNKTNMRLIDKYNKEVIGRAPQTLDEFMQAFNQTLRPIYAGYHNLAQQADQRGIRIDTAPIAAELRKFVQAKEFALPQFDAMRNYASETANRLEDIGSYQATEAEGTIRRLNDGLSAFYRASSPEAGSRAGIDDLVANQLRARVDQALNDAGIAGWQELRNAYGALKATEGEVAHRAGVYRRGDPAGGLVGRLGTIVSFEELARFATTFDPNALVRAAAITGARKWLEYWRGPNRAVKRMFEKAEQLQSQHGPIPPAPLSSPLQPPRPSGPSQSPYAGRVTPEAELLARGGRGVEEPSPTVLLPGEQPRRPTGPSQRIYGRDTPFGVYGGGSQQ